MILPSTFLENFIKGGLFIGIITTIINYYKKLDMIKLYGYIAGSAVFLTVYIFLFIRKQISFNDKDDFIRHAFFGGIIWCLLILLLYYIKDIDTLSILGIICIVYIILALVYYYYIKHKF